MDEETNQLILEELRILNQNFTDYKLYITDRNTALDEITAQEKQAKADAIAEEEQKQAETSDIVSPYTAQLEGIQTSLTALETNTTAYIKENPTLTEHLENVEFNTSYFTVVSLAVLSVVSILCGFSFGKTFFRKL